MKCDNPLFAVLLLLLFTSLSPIAAAQTQPDDDIDLRYRKSLTEIQIEQVSNDLAKDATAFLPVERAILWARLGDLWWKTDAERGRGFLVKAVEDVDSATTPKSALNPGQPNDRVQLISAIRVVMRIVGARDNKLSDRLISSLSTLTSETKGQSPSESSSYMADALTEAAVLALPDDPQRAARLGSAALRYGDPNQFNMLLIGLRQRDSKLADSLFNEAVATAQASRNINLFSSLTFAAFSANYNPTIKTIPPPPQIRAKLLNAIISGVIQEDLVSEPRDCSYASLIAPLLSEVDHFAPQQAGPVRNALAKCQSIAPGSDEAIRNQPLKTVEDFLSAAQKADRIELRVLFLGRAIQTAAALGRFDEAISILDGMSHDEHELMGDTWDPIRVQYAALAGLRHYKDKDYGAMERVINAVPQELQAFVTLNMAEAMLGENQEKNTLAIDLLGRSRRRFEKMQNSDFGTFYPYMSLVRAYGRVSPPDAYNVFREAVKSINRASSAVREKPDLSEQIARGEFEPLDIPAPLIQLSPFELISIVSSVDSPSLRTRLRLSLLGSLLTYKQSLAKVPERLPTKAKENK